MGPRVQGQVYALSKMARDRLPGKVTSEPGPRGGEEASDGLLGTNYSGRREEKAERPGVGSRSMWWSLDARADAGGGPGQLLQGRSKVRGTGNPGRCT